MKFILVLLANCLFILYTIFYLTDHPITRASVMGKVKQFLLVGLSLYILYNLLFIYLLKREKEESGLIYKFIAFAEKSAHATATFIQPIQKELIVGSLLALVFIVISLLLAGLPGGAVLSVLQKMGWFTRIKGDSTWPAAILLSILLPLCLPFAILAKQYLLQRGYEGFTGLRLLLGLFWIVLIIPLVALLSSSKA